MSLPSGYRLLEYIQSSGTQYIDTAYKNNQSTRIYMVIKADSPSSTSWAFGGRTSNTSATMGVFWYPSNSSWAADYNGNAQRYVFGSSIGSSDLLTIDFNKNVLSINGKSKTFTSATFQSTASIALLAVNTGGTVSGSISAKLYSCKIYDNDVLARDFVPCINESGEVGLYDLVNSAFYGNAGTGTFTAGPEIPAPEAPTALQTVLAVVLQWVASANADRYDIYRDGAKLGSTETTQYVDTTPEANQTYIYTVKAVNGGGESAGTSITVYTKSGYFEYKPLIESANFP